MTTEARETVSPNGRFGEEEEGDQKVVFAEEAAQAGTVEPTEPYRLDATANRTVRRDPTFNPY